MGGTIMTLERTNECAPFREHVSAIRDGEALPDEHTLGHVDTCPTCRAWVDASDAVTRHVRMRTPSGASVLTAAMAAWDVAAEQRENAVVQVGRLLLGLAALGCAVAAVVLAMGETVHTHLGGRAGRDLFVFEVAIAAGLAFAAWRPARFLTGVAPLLVVITGINVVMSVGDVVTGRASTLAELTHLPFLVGIAGVTLCRSLIAIGPTERVGGTVSTVSLR
jgi:predicted anti-sigma-YlaC factor YlaD